MKALKETEVLITGGAGFIGSHLCETFLQQGAKVIAYDNLSTGKIEYIRNLPEKKIKFLQGDIRDHIALEKAAGNCETIFHLAAQTSVPFSMKNPKEDFEVNAYGTLNVLEIARKKDARIIFASTAAVYGNAEKTPTPEDYPTQPISFYGLSKRVAEDYCQFYHENYGVEVVILRIFNVYGLRGHGVIPDFLDKLKKTPFKLEVLGTGEQSRDFIHVSDVVRAFVLCAQHQKVNGRTYNLGSGAATSVTAIARMMIALLNLRGVTKLSFTGGQAWEGDAKLTHADISKIVGELNWRPLVKLRDGIKNLLSQKDVKTVSEEPPM
ncbi:MAG: SDR family NAD(P)-dependent oxidoreductase [Candidatus Bathyarchaeota archaeon]|nr:SDR family NAD(P)-dependent oxidoreductase [Candidatus Bathyarchaeota archaeon]